MRAGIDCAVEVDVDFVVYRWVKVVGILGLSCIFDRHSIIVQSSSTFGFEKTM